MFKFRVNYLSIVYHYATHNLLTLKFYCEFETNFKENSYFNLLAAGEKNQVMRYSNLGAIYMAAAVARENWSPPRQRQIPSEHYKRGTV